MEQMIDFGKFKKIQVVDLRSASWNYKNNDPDTLELLKNNLKRNGQIENIIVRELKNGQYEVINGNHRLQALQELGIEDVVVCDLGKIKLPEAKRIAIETNETKFQTDELKLGGILKELSTEFDLVDLLGTLPFDEAELSRYAKLTDFSFDDIVVKEHTRTSETEAKPVDMSFKLPAQIAVEFQEQLTRIDKLLEFDDKQRASSIAVVTKIISQISDENLLMVRKE